MNIATKYNENNSWHNDEAKFVLQKYSNLLNWSKDKEHMVMDVGCGSGEITETIILPILPKNFKLLIGVDISNELMQFKQKANTNPKLLYNFMDIETKTLNESFLNQFDHIFSFCCFHWVKNQRQAYQNLYDLLKPEGDILISTLVENNFTQALEMLKNVSQLKKYHNYHPNLDKYKINLETILTEIGFDVKLLKLSVEERLYSMENFKGLFTSLKYITNAKEVSYDPENYLDEMIRVGAEMKLWKITPDNNNVINIYYKAVIIATKAVSRRVRQTKPAYRRDRNKNIIFNQINLIFLRL